MRPRNGNQHGSLDPGRGIGRRNNDRADRHHAGSEPPPRSRVQANGAALGPAQASEGPMTVRINVSTSKQVGDADHPKVFANQDGAETWFEENDPDG